jgi:hypothetical protein
MEEHVLAPAGGTHGWVIEVVDDRKRRARLSKRYYAAISDMSVAMSAVKASCRLRSSALLRARHALSKRDLAELDLRPGEVRKV